MVDAARRAVEEQRPALVIFGHELTGTDPLTEIARYRGLGGLSSTHLLQAMDAAGAASGCRFLLMIDALNDAADPGKWRTSLPALFAALTPYEHIALVISCRSTMTEAVLPQQLDAPRSTHPGFAGREAEALEAYLCELPAAVPRAPLLTPAFTNPLFVKLYADSLREAHLAGRAHRYNPRDRSAVFDAYVDTQAREICQRLHLDPLLRQVHAAVESFAARLAHSNRAIIPRAEAQLLVDSHAPSATAWPDTMLQQLISHGLLSNERLDDGVGVGFPYQAFGDDRIVRSVFRKYQADIAQLKHAGALDHDAGLVDWLTSASPNHIEAATALLPELANMELLDVLGTRVDVDGASVRQRVLHQALITTLPLRRADSVTQRTVTLLNEAATRQGMSSALLECTLAVTTDADCFYRGEGEPRLRSVREPVVLR